MLSDTAEECYVALFFFPLVIVNQMSPLSTQKAG